MKKILLLSLFCIVLLRVAAAQTDETKQNITSRPDIPGNFIIDFGFNSPRNKPTNFTTGFFGSSTVNLYYQYPIRLGKSKFSFNPGAGFSFERFKFTNGIVLSRVGQRYDLVPGSTQFSGILKTVLSERFFDIPLEFRFDTKPEDVANSFNVALGGRAGYLIDSMLKVKYTENGEKITNKDKQDFGLTKIRYGVYGRVGFGAFNLFFFYNLNPMFKANVGPEKTTMNTFTTGISVNGF